MSCPDLITFTTLLFKHLDLVSPGMGNNLTADHGSFDGRFTYDHVFLIINQENFIKAHRFTFLFLQAVNKYLLVFLHLVLLTCNIYNRVHPVWFFNYQIPETWECKNIKV